MVTCDLPDMYDLRPAGIHTALKPVGIYISGESLVSMLYTYTTAS